MPVSRRYNRPDRLTAVSLLYARSGYAISTQDTSMPSAPKTTTKTQTFPNAKAAIKNARELEKRGEISRNNVRAIEREVRKPAAKPR